MSKNQFIILSGICLLIGLGIGVLIGHFSTSKNIIGPQESSSTSNYIEDKDITKKILDRADPEKLSENLRFLTKNPHLAGTAENHHLAEEIEKRWRSYGFDYVKQVPYKVLLSHPNRNYPNKVHIVSSSGDILYSSDHEEEPLRPEDKHPDFIHAFHGYSPNGTVTGDVVYVNFARKEDFDELEKLGVSVAGKIVLAKYGKGFRGNKVKLAEERKAIGVILFSDPAEVALMGTDPQDVYPNSLWLPSTGIQRGTVAVVEGDPLTPGYPALDGAYRTPFKSIVLPKILSQPIGYKDAYELLRLMNGPDAPKEWQGGLNITYKLGPGLMDGKRVKLNIHNEYKFDQTIYNVIGIIKGSVEPDRYVLTGNHRDAWGFGAIDASTGTAQLLEVSRIYGELLKDGWRPRRSIVFCSWGGEEFALIGSFEWVEEHLRKLMDRAVTYINVDICTYGPIPEPTATPILKDAILQIMHKIPDPQDSAISLYDGWKKFHQKQKNTDAEPELGTLGSGSDHAPFTFFMGIPSVDLTFIQDKSKYNISLYPTYHTGYETYYMVEKYIDPGFKTHQSCARLSGLLVEYLADSAILPFNARYLAFKIKDSFAGFKTKNEELLKGKAISLDKLGKVIDEFSTAVDEWHQRVDKVDKNNLLEVRMMNDQIVKMEQCFILPHSYPGRRSYRHVLFAPSKYDQYEAKGFPILNDYIYEANKTNEPQLWGSVKRHLSDVTILIQQAKQFLQPVHEI